MIQPIENAKPAMRAAEYDAYGLPDVLTVRDVAFPEAVDGEVLVKVHASSVNPIDTIIQSGKLKFQTGRAFPKRTGIDFAGEVIGVDGAGHDFNIGDRVWGVMPLRVEKGFGQGSAAEFITISPARLSRSPARLDDIEAASLSSVGTVALITMRDRADLRPGERLLIRGGAGGVGCSAVQLAKHMGAHVTVLASAGDLDFLKALGADEALDYRMTKPGDLKPFDVLFDLAGTDLPKWRRRLSPRGRMFCLAIKGLGSILYIQASRIYGAKRVQFFSAAPMRATMDELARLVETGSVKPIVHSIYPLDQIADAQRSIEKGGGRGKRVVSHVVN